MKSEAVIQQSIRIAAANQGLQCWRNNTGACQDMNGRQIRYGLCNDSASLNKRIKSSDLVGITPVLITPLHVGRTFGVFTGIETKREDWHFTPGDARAVAQAAFHDLVRQAGGFAGFAQSEADLMRIIERAP